MSTIQQSSRALDRTRIRVPILIQVQDPAPYLAPAVTLVRAQVLVLVP